mmetsp:Transcript_44982/g.142823  ORF Transcript_44982/g.142823 Transcript_44982/m.142823 type:complete len:268 (+) Transcript_44982:227-1030(+)
MNVHKTRTSTSEGPANLANLSGAMRRLPRRRPTRLRCARALALGRGARSPPIATPADCSAQRIAARRAISLSVSSKLNTPSRSSTMCSFLSLCVTTGTPCCTSHRSATAAAVRLCAAATALTFVSLSTLGTPPGAAEPSGLYAIRVMLCLRHAARVASSRPHVWFLYRMPEWPATLKPHWLTAGRTLTCGRRLSMAEALKFETPIARARPSRASRSSTRHVATVSAVLSHGQCIRRRSTNGMPSTLRSCATSAAVSSGLLLAWQWFE